jgi:hypothetical protein
VVVAAFARPGVEERRDLRGDFAALDRDPLEVFWGILGIGKAESITVVFSIAFNSPKQAPSGWSRPSGTSIGHRR